MPSGETPTPGYTLHDLTLTWLKNAILIVEFANQRYAAGMPLVLASGAGAASRHSIGTGVFGGMLAATFLAIFFVPLFFVITARLSRKTKSSG